MCDLKFQTTLFVFCFFHFLYRPNFFGLGVVYDTTGTSWSLTPRLIDSSDPHTLKNEQELGDFRGLFWVTSGET